MKPAIAPDGYHLVDATVGARLVVGFAAPATRVQQRLPAPWRLFPEQFRKLYARLLPAVSSAPSGDPNLLLVFNDLLLNQNKRHRYGNGVKHP